MSRSTSERLEYLRFPLIVGVVFVHAYESSVNTAAGSVGLESTAHVSDFLRTLFSNGIGRISPPLFFVMSGYLIFYGTEWSLPVYFAKIQRRIKTLFVPYLFWNFVALSIYFIAQSLPLTQQYISGNNQALREMNFFELTNTFLGVTKNPIAYQFWFVRDLMILVLAIPAIHLLLAYIPFPFLGFACVAWFVPEFGLSMPPAASAILFFSIGAYFASKGGDIFALDKYSKVIFLCYIPVLIGATLTYGYAYHNAINQVGILIGLPAVLCLSGYVRSDGRTAIVLKWLAGVSFFVFAMHQPLLLIVKKVVFAAVNPQSDFAILLLYFLIPLFVIAVTVGVFEVMSQVFPRMTALISGGRLPERPKHLPGIARPEHTTV
ncbi:Acyltransferase family protein [Thalassoglobus neptunius]|uniref:Acyltransferase family protein n=1 Tax=Thalassoglobus neptunius TaxID=1938619 RepID=A0A5C5WDR5_9PLAN|nr:acyltransferase [Thalassoglobus neptunius]TWT48241.1 Acyltransferase family protein [Thalassoglobus neptunius]